MMIEEPIFVDESLLNLSPSEQEGESPLDDRIAELQEQLSQTLEQLHQCQQEKQEILDRIQQNKKKYKIILQLSAVVLLIASIVHFHQEMGQVGWNWLQSIAAILESSAEQLCGILLFLGLMYLLWKLFLYTIHAAAEEFMEGVDDDDLADW